MLNKIYLWYMGLILNPKPSKTWQVIRFLLHWLTLFPKLIGIGGLGFYQIIKNLKNTGRTAPEVPDLTTKKAYFKKVFDNLPVLKDDELQLYTLRIPKDQIPNGSNQNTDHQCSRQGTYEFLMNRLGLNNNEINSATMKHIQGGRWLCRGYKINPYEGQYMYNAQTVSGDMLCGLNLAMLNNTERYSKEKYEELIRNIIDFDYSLPEHDGPNFDDPTYPIYQKLSKYPNGQTVPPNELQMKSSRANWQPGIETVGAQALTLLASIRIAEKVCKDPYANKTYKKMLYLFGYGLLSLFPTAYIDSQRGYFNDHNCLISLYTLFKLSDNILGKIFWSIPTIYVWLLSRHWYNGYFTGLVADCLPKFINKKYIQKCQAYLYEKEPNVFHNTSGPEEKIAYVPANYNDCSTNEFFPDSDMNLIQAPGANDPVRTGLGFLAAAIMLEKDPKCLLN